VSASTSTLENQPPPLLCRWLGHKRIASRLGQRCARKGCSYTQLNLVEEDVIRAPFGTQELSSLLWQLEGIEDARLRIRDMCIAHGMPLDETNVPLWLLARLEEQRDRIAAPS